MPIGCLMIEAMQMSQMDGLHPRSDPVRFYSSQDRSCDMGHPRATLDPHLTNPLIERIIQSCVIESKREAPFLGAEPINLLLPQSSTHRKDFSTCLARPLP